MLRPLLAATLCTLPLTAAAEETAKPRQLVIVSFDGAHDNRLWVKSLDMAKRTGAHFTYFLSCTFLMTKAGDGRQYKAPGKAAGRSNVGFAQSEEEIAERAGHIWQAHLDGHDIGSHACGHFDGSGWSKADWQGEFSVFRTALENAWKTGKVADKEPAGWQDFVKTDILGFRAPYLATSPGLVPALKAAGFTYDASLVSKGPAEPDGRDGLPRFALPLVPEGPTGRPVIAMDYNLFVRHSMGVENRRDSAAFEDRALTAYRQAFEAQYGGQRIPLELGFHFVEMNGGAYWRALDRFLTETCKRPDVACVSYAEALQMPELQRKELKQKKAAGAAL
ncbi:hypothetical protein SAMN05880582_1011363 [Rhizobium sp. RU20A]|uniref:polysaccharide deacetylase n=1 Tax=Rhizobium sp. RU20A TaxID=1907412 RepID=UPI000955AC45|nr:polysaccharide deacetylase [Rhizobium sp. RU20A]SIQ28397.1 hypothetical protein SAMN05880582_1011363 [Rhizobium sp. RU20A]